MPRRAARGESLVELIVALVILEIVGAAALAAGLTVEQLGRHATQGNATDVARWEEYRVAETRPTCVGAATADSIALVFPPMAGRPALPSLVRCGR